MSHCLLLTHSLVYKTVPLPTVHTLPGASRIDVVYDSVAEPTYEKNKKKNFLVRVHDETDVKTDVYKRQHLKIPLNWGVPSWNTQYGVG